MPADNSRPGLFQVLEWLEQGSLDTIAARGEGRTDPHQILWTMFKRSIDVESKGFCRERAAWVLSWRAYFKGRARNAIMFSEAILAIALGRDRAFVSRILKRPEDKLSRQLLYRFTKLATHWIMDGLRAEYGIVPTSDGKSFEFAKL